MPFPKGHTPWNAGKKTGQVAWNKLPEGEARKRDRERCNRNYYAKKAEYAARQKAWALKNADKVSADHKTYYWKNKESHLKKCRAYHAKNWDKILPKKREYHKAKRKRDPQLRVALSLRERVRFSVKNSMGRKHNGTMLLIGCSVEFLMKHLESLWLPGMSWENYGRKGWHIDHIRPCASFDLTSERDQLTCFHWTNMQPLWWLDNLIKGAKLQIDSLSKIS